jgi:alkylated DNA repair dioxygenase AlkB
LTPASPPDPASERSGSTVSADPAVSAEPVVSAAAIPGAMAIRRPGLALLHGPRWLGDDERQALQQHLETAIPWEQPEVRVFGRVHPVPRLVAWYADPGCSYRYSGLCHGAAPWTPSLAALREQLRRRLGLDFNSLLLNRYRSGADRMGWHADDEPELEADHPIASLSLGASRTLRFRPRPPRRDQPADPALEPFGLELAAGDLLLMEAPTQMHWHHALPPRLRLQQERFNLTFRRIRTE